MRNGGRTRVAVTGVGVVSPLGIGREEMWRSVAEGRSGAGLITLFDAADSPVRMACEAHGFDPTDFMERRAARRMDRYAQLAVAAARLAVADSGLTIDDDGAGIGAIIANGGSGTISREEQHRVMLERGPDRVSPFAIPLSVANMGAGQVSIELGLRGPVTAVCTACAAGTDAIGTAADIIRRGDARAMLAGGGDCLISPFFVAGFDAMRVLSHRNDDPAGAARPFDRDRDGFLVGEAGAVLVLERVDDAVARGAHIVCEVAGYGASADAHHLTDPDPSGVPQARALTAALAGRGHRPRSGGPRQRARRRQQARRPGRGADPPARPGRGGGRAGGGERDQVDARPLHGGRRGARGGHHRPRPPGGPDPADPEPARGRPSPASGSTTSPTPRGPPTSAWPCPPRSASAATTRRWC